MANAEVSTESEWWTDSRGRHETEGRVSTHSLVCNVRSFSHIAIRQGLRKKCGMGLQQGLALAEGHGRKLLLIMLCALSGALAADDVITEADFSYPILWNEDKLVNLEMRYSEGANNFTVGDPLQGTHKTLVWRAVPTICTSFLIRIAMCVNYCRSLV
jgi:hypothetical protein